MNLQKIQEKIDKTEITWNCHSSRGEHEIGCPHKKWSVKELQDALTGKKKFEQSGLKGEVLTS